jgi:predicted small metal-binding protein
MATILHCGDVGFDCEGVIHADTEEEVLQQAATHAQTVHHVTELTEEIVENVRSAIHDESVKA